MILVNWRSRILGLVQGRKKDNDFHAFQDIHNGLLTIKKTVESLTIFGENLQAVDSGKMIYAFKNKPSTVEVNGVVQTLGKDYNIVGNYVKFFSALGSGAVVTTHYLGQQ